MRTASAIIFCLISIALMKTAIGDLANLIDFENDGPFPTGVTSYTDDAEFTNSDVFTLTNGTTVAFEFIKDVDGLEGSTAATAADDPSWYSEDTANIKVVGSSGFSPNETFAYLSTDPTAKPAGSTTAADGLAEGFETQGGDYMLRGGSGTGWTDFVITYGGTAVSSASGEIWDLDQGVDGVRVTAYDSSFNELAYQLYDISEGDDDLDSKPWVWNFSNVGTIGYIYVSKLEAFGSVAAGQYANFDGDPTTGSDLSNTNFRMAFNNFNATSSSTFALPAPVPEPTSLLSLSGIFSLGLLSRVRRKSRFKKLQSP